MPPTTHAQATPKGETRGGDRPPPHRHGRDATPVSALREHLARRENLLTGNRGSVPGSRGGGRNLLGRGTPHGAPEFERSQLGAGGGS